MVFLSDVAHSPIFSVAFSHFIVAHRSCRWSSSTQDISDVVDIAIFGLGDILGFEEVFWYHLQMLLCVIGERTVFLEP